jgi:hypothetical protein
VAIAGPAKYGGNPLNGSMTINTGGTFTNKGTISVASMSMAAGTVLVNSNSFTFQGGFNVTTNSYLHNAGSLFVPDTSPSANDTLTVDNGGRFRDDGLGFIRVNRLTISAGAIFMPGGVGIGTTLVQGNSVGTAAGRVTLVAGSTNIFKVNPAASQKSTFLYAASGYLEFGTSIGNPAFSGAFIVFTNINVGGYTNGQVFTPFGNTDRFGFSDVHNIVGTGAATNVYPIMQPDPPKAGLTWDLSNLRYLRNNSSNGIVRIKGLSTNSPVLSYSPAIYYDIIQTNISGGNTNITTNDYIVANVSWPATNTGWRLEFEQNPVTVGLLNYDTNWAEIFNGRWTNQLILTNTLGTNSGTLFYRMRLPTL